MRHLLIAALLPLALPAAAQTSAGWELRAGLNRASASICDSAGSCFGVTCTAAAGWRPVWFAEVLPQGEATTDPILAIRTDAGRFALTGLASVPGAEGPGARYEGPVSPEDDALLTALQMGESLNVDPGRDFALAGFDLRGSSWAIGTALGLCGEGGPDVGNAAPVAAEEEDDA